ncbi:MAG: 50S ribosomal protein L9 [Candidatus Komeilibacteria bacterium CG_4_10_14_0_2_um_filter_37_10]|uniref:Large ribosomal subunit protein bL9 n=1 Tax=Candidatus Komeilibacteria bacterium CG_4_10_14_0_2_um_filter_37_10 TaxID=1974470 RepID=A0A2M7VDY2_9BACT|nr:MAG: 50S ribosomal protein L9 [Candidatus Komeilibacteria bacterium CG_4_10_14_0_2_um_filter_37_10]PJA92832.1 MAG: 50S ribosomal protein L9 [Candidatus Komeilibacteria bacterium CG_4_9_14_3_um_filter_37_5]
MQILFIKNCIHGRVGEIKEVKDGLALNFLIPQKLAFLPTPTNIRLVQQNKQKDNKQLVDLPKQEKIIHILTNATLQIKVRVNDQNHLYAAINEQQIVDSIKEQFKIDLPNKSLQINQNVKKLGSQEIEIILNKQAVKLKINISKK